MITVGLTNSLDDIVSKILQATAKNINRQMALCKTEITSLTRTLLEGSLIKQPEYDAIISSDLRFELGLVDAFGRMSTIVKELVDSVDVEIKPVKVVGARFSGGMTITAVKSGYDDILSLREASFLTEKGVQLDWLEWLLLEGTNVIIADYHFQGLTNVGRTGGGIMLEGDDWGVPPEHSGTINDNFITRAIEDIQKPLKKVIKKCLMSA